MNDQLPAEEIRIHGIVQGVGFRPFVFRAAQELGLRGNVQNNGGAVRIRVAGLAVDINRFVEILCDRTPPLARIDRLERSLYQENLESGFQIIPSVDGEFGGAWTGIGPDTGTCPDCMGEVFNIADRRHRYPFTNCTNCGPRLSIVRDLPYDRENTSMAAFPLCPLCRGEYETPGDRRFHAEPNACPACGPQLRFVCAKDWRDETTSNPIIVAQERIKDGAIIAVKGLGGYQLTCLATDETSVDRLRQRKHRYEKPFALLGRDLDMVRRYCAVSPAEAELLKSPEAPIVILAAHGPENVAPSVAPGQRTLGFMLPSTPLYHLLMERADGPLVMTSGNRSDEPQVIRDDEARERLSDVADWFLTHNRDIINRVDDSVVRSIAGRPRLTRRARGYVPAALPLPPGFEDAPSVLAFGGELKSTICLARTGKAVVSQHLGDLEEAATVLAYRDTLNLYLGMLGEGPDVLAADLHPDMASSKFAEDIADSNGLVLTRVQHHHAHAAACMAENLLPLDTSPVLAVVFDGLGLGPDGTLWGGEFLSANYITAHRLATLSPVPMPGGEKAIREPWRMAYAHLSTAFDWKDLNKRFPSVDFFQRLSTRPVAQLAGMVASGVNAPATSAAGRLFDAVSSVVGLRDEVSYEGQAAIDLETAIGRNDIAEPSEHAYRFSIREKGGNGLLTLDPHPMWEALLQDLEQSIDISEVSTRFHCGLAVAVVETINTLRKLHDDPWKGKVSLSGGVFQNVALFELVSDLLKDQGMEVLSHSFVPCNDGGLSLGQAVVAAARSARN
ncbi:MAG: carbamoyltransferase HypF [Rhodospirillaceae bacterium]|nr:carbamoyltransferase HypF [Rhodospirillales bacterium]MBT3906959.1 carbamoyltransferase HypF [Rhodospirillaceae bacterium]MBT4699686.1 carbamoyltransferase HypF [Rhodospirillaceae bacterium]MBT5034441.1 carbamoyltransferase HypF [Rhodospirillaceae bacterium]MBT6218407.1 carbamoyltransferase HypF [Rhodospirillaceae bacterium]